MSKGRIGFLGFMTLDYKALQIYLNQMAAKGYELKQITKVLPFGKFEKSEEAKSRSYYVDIFDKQEEEDYIALCEESGWTYSGAIHVMKVFKQKEKKEAIPIQTDVEIETKLASATFLNKELLPWFMLTPLLLIQFIMGIQNFDYTSLLSYLGSMSLIWVPLAMSYLIVMLSLWLTYRRKAVKALNEEKVLKVPSIQGARCRGYFSYGYVLLIVFLLIWSAIGDFGNEPRVVIASFIPIIFITIGSYGIGTWSRKKKNKQANWIAVLFIVGSILAWPFLGIWLISTGDYTKNDWELQKEAAYYPVLTLNEVNVKEMEEEPSVRLDKGHSFFVKASYQYIERAPRDSNLNIPVIETQYIEARSAWLAEFIFNNMLEEIERWEPQMLDERLYDVEEAYYFKGREVLLLKKGKILLKVEGMGEEGELLNAPCTEAIKGLFIYH
ncbi:hypothetical protein CS063_15460 [Sporanaerobium hydrogeniformans]|uniref:Uncharacterized protein n=1 Tax=Sporanaerobium hydrogeniformans TaxID=3072179 RepID=A0AC61D7L5_9FIRM|nr:DUF2812 domain-containing protein [Sporanaerobium hydrogeniformans]PHV69519.1 hypothetical protein CS063_15460 [Sporanaerobium hydrogeniformans]